MKRRQTPYEQHRILIIAWIATATEFMITTQRHHTLADIDAGIEHAVDLYVNHGETPGSAIPKGVQLARRRIMHRHAVNRYCAIIGAFIIQLNTRTQETNP